MKQVLVLSLVLFVGVCAFTQDVPKVEIPVGFSMINVHPNLSPITSFNVFGGGGQFDVNFGRFLGLKADFMGYTQGSGLKNQLAGLGYAGQVSGNMFTYMFGPQIKKHSGKFQPFAEFLFGAAHTNAYANILNAEGKVASGSSDNNAFAMALGGGIDIKASKHVSIRLLEVDYMMTRFGSNVVNYTANQNNFRYVGGLNFTFGGAPPLPPMAMSCSAAQPASIMAGEPVAVSANVTNIPPKHTLTYAWKSTGGKVTGNGTNANVDTAGLEPGNYTVTATATDPKPKKDQGPLTCSSNFTVNEPPKHPPTASCSANPTTVRAGDPSTITVTAGNPDNRPLTYNWTTTAGRVSGSGTTATLDTAGANAGPITVTATVSDDRGLTANCSASVNVEVPPPPPQASQLNTCQFNQDKKRPWRVDNTCKAILDEVALRLQREADSKLVIVGHDDPTADGKNAANYAAQRAVNSKEYLSGGEAKQQIDPSRIEVRTGVENGQTADYWLVPAGATFNAEGTTPVDESAVKAPAKKAPAKKKKAAPAQ